MPLIAFENLRARHPDLLPLAKGLESLLVQILTKDPNAVIDDRVLADRLRLASDQEEDDLAVLLADLVAHEALRTTVFWKCANGFGTSTEARTIPELPESIECDRCGQRHPFSADELEVLFLPGPALMNDIAAAAK